MGFCDSVSEVKELIRIGTLFRSQNFSFQPWNFRAIEEKRKQEFRGGLVTMLDVPLFLKTKEFSIPLRLVWWPCQQGSVFAGVQLA